MDIKIDSDFRKKYSCYNENIVNLSKYLLQLYFRVGGKYNCTSEKLRKLLVIYKLCCMKEKIDFCGSNYTLTELFDVPFVSDFFPQDIIRGIVCQNSYPICDELSAELNWSCFCSSKFPNSLRESDIIGVHSKDLIEKIFRKFGNYRVAELSEMIRQINLYGKIHEVPLEDYEGKEERYVFDFSAIPIEKMDHNPVFDFIYNFKSKCGCRDCYSKTVVPANMVYSKMITLIHDAAREDDNLANKMFNYFDGVYNRRFVDLGFEPKYVSYDIDDTIFDFMHLRCDEQSEIMSGIKYDGYDNETQNSRFISMFNSLDEKKQAMVLAYMSGLRDCSSEDKVVQKRKTASRGEAPKI